ncbi:MULTISPECIES: beta-N-acetylhexosaminidase [Rhodonellum]|nr:MULTISPECIES: beta-N-acetylhexosaminidase [Rhodonellum]
MKSFPFLFFALLAILFTSCSKEKTPNMTDYAIIPQPISVVGTGDSFELVENTQIHLVGDSAQLTQISAYLQQLIQNATSFDLQTNTETEPGEGAIVLALDPSLSVGNEGYQLDITKQSIKLSASSEAGLFFGIQTLRQLFPAELEIKSQVSGVKWRIPTGIITDSPEYAYRGAMLDVARHFFSVEDVKHYIDLLAFYKMNMLHLHLSDDQGWRIEIKSWPNLTTIGGSTQVGGGKGGFYTQEQYKDIVAYAQERFITIIPEIDMPGHTNSALASYGELNPGITVPKEHSVKVDRAALGVEGLDPLASELYTGIVVGFSTLATDKEITYQFVDDVIRELAEMTPGPYIHIGGDESHVTEMKDYIPFINRAQEIVAKYGKTSIGWDEIAHATLLPGSVAQYWAVAENAKMAVDQGAQVIMSPATKAYLDMQYDSTTVLGLHWAAYIELDSAYNWEPTAMVDGIGKSNILGIEAPLWTETITNRSELEYMVFPRITAIAEIAWVPKESKDWDSYKKRLIDHGKRWELMGINYYKSPLVDWGK